MYENLQRNMISQNSCDFISFTYLFNLNCLINILKGLGHI